MTRDLVRGQRAGDFFRCRADMMNSEQPFGICAAAAARSPLLSGDEAARFIGEVSRRRQ